MKKYILPLAVMLAASTLTSCLDDEDNGTKTTTTDTYANCFNTVYDNTTGESTIVAQPKYTLESTYSSSNGVTTLKVTMTNIMLPDMAYNTFELPEMTFNVPGDKPAYIEATDVKPTNIGSNAGVTFTHFRLEQVNFYTKDPSEGSYESHRVYNIRFTINNRYVVNVYPTTALYFGTTTSTSTAVDGSVFSTASPLYSVTFDVNSKKARVDITGAQFLQNMPALNMTFSDIDFTAGLSSLTLKTDALTPTIAGQPYPDFPITNVESNLNWNGSGELDFHCKASRFGDYDVNAKLQNLPLEPTMIQ